MHALGIDIGGTGIKGAPVDVTNGTLLAERRTITTPSPATPDAVRDVLRDLVGGFDWSGPVGVTFPGVVAGGRTRTAANLDPRWIDLDVRTLLGAAVGREVRVLNDADAAGVAEMTFGAGNGQHGTVLLLTFGTGIGSALFSDGTLVPNTEFGHLELHGADAEKSTSELAREREKLSWVDWAARVRDYLRHVESLLAPRLIIVGGGISSASEKFLPLLTGLHCHVVPAAMYNDAGIVGAAMAAHSGSEG